MNGQSSAGLGRPRVTVIVPGYDVEHYAEEALASLRAQTLTDWTAVLVDDASTDATASVFERAAAEDPRFTVVRHPTRRGLGAARNTGLDHVRTPYLAFLDSDDVMTPDALALLVGSLEASGSDFVLGAYVRLRPDDAGGYTPGEVQPWVAGSTDPARSGTTIEAHPEASANVVAWSKLSRADFWTRAALRFPEGRLYEDQIIAQLMYTRARAFDVVPDVITLWRVRADGSSITQREASVPVLHDAIEAMLGGLSVLTDAAVHRPGIAPAVQARAGLLLRMDLPRIAAAAPTHPDAAYRRAVGAFAREVWATADAATRAGLDPDAATVASAARLW